MYGTTRFRWSKKIQYIADEDRMGRTLEQEFMDDEYNSEWRAVRIDSE